MVVPSGPAPCAKPLAGPQLPFMLAGPRNNWPLPGMHTSWLSAHMERTSQSALSTSNQEQCQQPVSKYFSFWALHQMQHTNHYSASPPTTRLPRLNKTATATQIDSAVLQPFLSLWIYAIQNHHHRQMELCTLPDALNIWQAVLKVWLLCNQHLHPCNYEQEDCSMLQAQYIRSFIRPSKTHTFSTWLIISIPSISLHAPCSIQKGGYQQSPLSLQGSSKSSATACKVMHTWHLAISLQKHNHNYQQQRINMNWPP